VLVRLAQSSRASVQKSVRDEHVDDNVVDEDRGVGARGPHGSLDHTGWDLHCIDERQAGKSYVVL
jgi:hypothetical protein